MLGGMIFATASSVTTSLNLAAAVLTNDVYKPLRPHASENNLMWVAKITTLLFGVGTIAVAFMVPLAGGIVEVVLSIGAVTGGALYGPAIWALFSKRQTGQSVLWITGISLAINLFFKFISPAIFNFSLSRSMEMLVGVGLPFLLLACYEAYAILYGKIIPDSKDAKAAGEDMEEIGSIQNLYGIKVLTVSFVTIGFIFLILTIWAAHAAIYLAIMGSLIIALGILLYYAVIKYTKAKPQPLKKVLKS